MGSKKPIKHVTSKTSAAANPTASSTTHTANQSSILRSSFAPSRLGAPFFASVIQGFDSQHLRIHDTTSGRLHCEHPVNSRTLITCLDWGYLGQSGAGQQQQESLKKRKRSKLINGVSSAKNVVLAYGTSRSEIQIYSPTESHVLRVLKDAHSGGIRDFKFVNDGHESKAYSIGGDGKLVQWDLKTQRAIMTMQIPINGASTVLQAGSKVICASHYAYLMDPKSKASPIAYNASTNNIHTILGSHTQLYNQLRFLTVAEIDHFINVFEENSPTMIGSLRTENEILAADMWSLDSHSTDDPQELTVRTLQPRQALAVLNKDAVLEIFPEPFEFAVASSGRYADTLKARMKQRSRKSVAQVKIVRPDESAAQSPLINISFQDDHIALAWADRGVNLIFDTVQWRDGETGKLILKDVMEIVKAKIGSGLGAVTMNGVKDIGKSQVDDSHAVVVNGMDVDDVLMEEAEPEVINISSAEEESDFEDEPIAKSSLHRNAAEDVDEHEEGQEDVADSRDESMQDASAREEPQEEIEPPSFGDLMRASAPDPINVPNALTDANPHSLVPTNLTSLQVLPSGMSLGTVLAQSLRTNDTNLLESCLHTKDLSTVRSTIERLDSSFATNLLQRLAERLHNRPGRAGSLMVWIQWTLVAHGGYLAGQPEVMRKLRSLHKVVKERAGSLQSLLSLKGKLDMLEAQMNLRQSMLERSRGANVEDEDDEEAVIYVEGQEADSSEDEDGADISDEADAPDATASNDKALLGTGAVDEQGNEDEDEDSNTRPMTNGIPADAEEVSDSDEEGMVDNEASETDDDSGEELDDDVNHESVDTESSDGEASPPPKRPAKGRLSNGVGSRGHL